MGGKNSQEKSPNEQEKWEGAEICAIGSGNGQEN